MTFAMNKYDYALLKSKQKRNRLKQKQLLHSLKVQTKLRISHD